MNEMQAHGLLIPVGSMPIEVWIDKNNSLDELQNFVNGNVDVLRVLGNGVDLWFNKEYLFNGSQPNRAIYATKHMEEVGYLDQLTFGHPVKEGELYSLICGDFVAFGVDEEGEIASLPQETIDKLKETFADPSTGYKEYMDSRYMSGHTVDTGHAFTVSPGTYEPYIGIHDPVYGAGYMMVDLDKPFEVPMNRIWIAMDDYSGPETKEGLRGMYHSPQDVSAFSDPFCGSVSVTSTRDEKQEPAKSGLEAKRDACALSAAHLDSPNTEIPNGKNMERE